MSALFALFLLSCGAPAPAPPAEDARAGGRGSNGTVCDSTAHETSAVDPPAQFDFGCAIAFFQDAGCDFTLDPGGDGTPISSSAIEDLFDDPASCQSGLSCSGCTDGDTIDTVTTCEGLAATSYFTAGAWRDLAAACPPQAAPEAQGCTIEGVQFDAEEAACARHYWETVWCPPCSVTFDPRTCEDAINDPVQCQIGDTCTGCDDGDGRGNGVTCDEIADYAYFGQSSAELLLRIVRAHPCGLYCSPACHGRTCGDDGCGGSCGTCGDTEVCGPGGTCESEGCTIEGVHFDQTLMDCALSFFETMDCETCTGLFDARTCEDAINDPALCNLGVACDGCTDDDRRDDGVTCDEIEGYLYFGQTAAQQLYDYVLADPSCGAPALVVEGIPLSPEQAAAIVGVANQATEEQLDVDADLDSRAAANLVAERPFATIEAVAAVSYVGGSAIEKLRDYAASQAAPAGP